MSEEQERKKKICRSLHPQIKEREGVNLNRRTSVALRPVPANERQGPRIVRGKGSVNHDAGKSIAKNAGETGTNVRYRGKELAGERKGWVF